MPAKRVLFLHPDLGIGGAERLVVDAAVALKSSGYEVNIITNHHDHSHCFDETLDPNLGVMVVGDWLPRSVFGYLHAFFANLRMLLATVYLICVYKKTPDIVFVDQISLPLILLRLFGYKTIFYCHFPDLLLTDRKSVLKRIYRYPLDYLEEFSTGFANKVFVNSEFTSGVFRKTFSSLGSTSLSILYPVASGSSLQIPDHPSEKNPDSVKLHCRNLLGDVIQPGVQFIFVSINRYERKKNLSLALYALEYMFGHWDQIFSKNTTVRPENIHLVIAGGYDTRVVENVEYYDELVSLAERLHIQQSVSFLRSCSSTTKSLLIGASNAIIYTPENEHFGIVPVEAMLLSRPVIALGCGGPKETVQHDVTGFLCSVDSTENLPALMAGYMGRFVNDPTLTDRMGEAGHQRALDKFSFSAFKTQLSKTVSDMLADHTKTD